MWSPFFTCGTSLPTSMHGAGALVAEHGAGHDADVAVLEREVGVAHAARAELDHDVTRAGRRRLEVLDREWPTGFDEDCGPHSGPPLAESVQRQSYRATCTAASGRPGAAAAKSERVARAARLRFSGASRRVLRARPGPSPRRRCSRRPISRPARGSPHGSVPDVIAAVERGDADGGVVPIENMIEGSVSVTLDTLAFESELLIQREIDLPVSLNLCAPPGVGPRRRPHGRVVPARDRAVPGLARPRSCRRPRPGRRTPPPTRPGRSPGRSAATSPRSATRSPPSSTGSRCSPPTSRTTPRTRPASCSSAAGSPRRPATTRRRSCASSARTARARCSASSRSSRPAT